jgi:hypothetical protein
LGQFTEDYESESSNWQELEIIAIAIEEYAQKNPWVAVELFMFTTNFVTECAYFCGTPMILILFGLVL